MYIFKINGIASSREAVARNDKKIDPPVEPGEDKAAGDSPLTR
jgi:hypothetical protein